MTMSWPVDHQISCRAVRSIVLAERKWPIYMLISHPENSNKEITCQIWFFFFPLAVLEQSSAFYSFLSFFSFFVLKAGWKESHATFMTELRNLQATGLTTIGQSLRTAFDLLNLNRLVTGIDNYGQVCSTEEAEKTSDYRGKVQRAPPHTHPLPSHPPDPQSYKHQPPATCNPTHFHVLMTDTHNGSTSRKTQLYQLSNCH